MLRNRTILTAAGVTCLIISGLILATQTDRVAVAGGAVAAFLTSLF